MSRMEVFAKPGARLVVGLAGVAVTAVTVRRDRIGRREAAVFRRLNRLPDGLFVPGWVMMQLGTLGAAPVAAATAYATGRRRLALRLLLSGTATWSVSKLVKLGVQRPRPIALIPDACCRGPEATGLGYVSGHAGVVVALAVAAWPDLAPAARAAVVVAVPTVGMCRIYVGAHLPLDVVGGAAAGLAVDAIVTSLVDGADRQRQSRAARGARRRPPPVRWPMR